VALRLLAQEERFEEVAEVTRVGRTSHAAWVERVFAGHLEGRRGRRRAMRRAQLVALTDVYVWKLLRRDLGLSRTEAERATREMIEALSTGGS
jgi:hypothetical protein